MTNEEQQQKRIDELNAALVAAKKDAANWHDAWFEQREKTGIAYWQGYANGKKVAIDWHTKEANQRKEAAKSATDPADKNYHTLDARYHEYSIEGIQKSG